MGYQQLPADPEWAERYAYLNNPSTEPKLLLQKVEHPSHIHLDSETDNSAAEVARLSKLGAFVIKQMPLFKLIGALRPSILSGDATTRRFCPKP
ncbi:VOC family protein [Rheinheimera sp. KL1]|uniref:VOC family protein n=1 Tax=Rheinheimera sp. KL1 TaxID=1635005 RepID=UPI0006A9CC67|nr:VOC family protein [Rheinheimera sp. KL1]